MHGEDFAEFTIRVSDDEKTLTKKFPIYHNGICLSHDDPDLREMVESTIKDFKSEASEVQIKIKYMW